MTTQQPLYRIVYADGKPGLFTRPWVATLRAVRSDLQHIRECGAPQHRPVRVERVSPAPRATGGER